MAFATQKSLYHWVLSLNFTLTKRSIRQGSFKIQNIDGTLIPTADTTKIK